MADESAATPRVRPVAELRHDLRTPLNHIIGYGEMLIEDAEEQSDAASLETLRAIHATAKELVGVIQNTLSANKTQVTEAELHELRDRLKGPLEGVIASASGLLDSGADLSAKDLETIRAAAERLLNMAGEAATPVVAPVDTPATTPAPAVVEGTP